MPGVVAPLPSTATGRTTFGSFNNVSKINVSVVALWARLLRALPTARLLIRGEGYASRLTLERFALQGIEGERLMIEPWASSISEHLAHYSNVDIALDTFPYNGTTTTCDALWMGVPVVTLHGDRHAARVGASLLHAVGLPELVADDADAFMAAAIGLARDPQRLAALRFGLRERMIGSALCDANGFASAMEAAYRAAWRTWCHGQRELRR